MKNWLIRKLGGKSITVVIVDKTHRGISVSDSFTIPVVRDTLIFWTGGKSITIKSDGSVHCTEVKTA